MNTYDKLSRLYQRWLQRNRLNPLISADDLLYDHHCGNITLSNIQEKWVRKFVNVWWKAEEHEFEKSKTDEEKIEDLRHVFFDTDKRSFNEYFSEEYGFTCNEDITYKQMLVLCQKLLNTENKTWR